jgi:hypothetical protein
MCFVMDLIVSITVAGSVGRSISGATSSNLTRGMDVCVGLFCVCAVLCVGKALR